MTTVGEASLAAEIDAGWFMVSLLRKLAPTDWGMAVKTVFNPKKQHVASCTERIVTSNFLVAFW